MIIRPAQPSDLPGILEIYNEAIANTTATYDVEPHSLAQRQAWFDDHQKNDYPIFVAHNNNTILGWSSLNRFHQKPGYRFTVDNSVYVAPTHQGQGIGKALLAPLLSAGQTRGFHAILALIDADNAVSVRMHEAFGFEKVGYLKQVGFKFNRWLDVVYMECLLQVES